MNMKQVLVLCLLFAGIIARPVQSQTLGACGLPTSPVTFTSATAVKTLNMTADCTVPATGAGVGSYTVFMNFTSGEFTINGNGHRITGATNSMIIYVQGSATVNLHNVIIDQTGSSGQHLMQVRDGRTLNIRDTIIRNTTSRGIRLLDRGEINLTNVAFLNNTQHHTAALVQIYGPGAYNSPNARLNTNNVIFRGNRVAAANRVIHIYSGAVTFNGCLTTADNFYGSTPARFFYDGNTPTDNNTGECPPQFSYWLSLTPQPKKKSKATATPWPSATPRPPESYRQEYIELQEETGIDISATHGLASGVHFRQLDGAGIGVQALIDAGPLAAIDVYGYVEQGVDICFPHIGRVIFLDAAASPRAMMPLEAWVDDGATCVSIDSPGSLVLLPPS